MEPLNPQRSKMKKTFSSRQVRFFLLFAAFYLMTAALIVFSNLPPSDRQLVPGEKAPHTVRARLDFFYESPGERELRFNTVRSNTPPVYRFNGRWKENLTNRWSRLSRVFKATNEADLRHKALEEGFLFTPPVIKKLLEEGIFIDAAFKKYQGWYSTLSHDFLLCDHLEDQGRFNQFLVIQQSGQDWQDSARFLECPPDLFLLNQWSEQRLSRLSLPERKVAVEILYNCAIPSVILDENARSNHIQFELAKHDARDWVRKGNFLVRRGDTLDRDTIDLLMNHRKAVEETLVPRIPVLLILALALFALLLYRFQKFEYPTFRKLYNIITALLFFMIAQLGYAFGPVVTGEFPGLPMFLVLPFAFACISLPTLLNNTRAAIILLISYSLFYVFYPSFEWYSFTQLIVLSLTTIYIGQIVKSRNDYLPAAAIIAGIGLVFALLYPVVSSEATPNHWPLLIMAALVNGLLCVVLSAGLSPIIENILNIPTRFRLLELTNPTSSPLLRLLKNEAPGTYNHSILLGDMCEAAAEKLGIDSFLARAGGYFHDIGKTQIPEYFIENQENENLHDEIKPSVSVSVIKSHIKIGVELARKYRIPEEVIDYIREHHGTTSIAYFYHQAQGLFGDEHVNIEDYEYAGPKPRSKGTALLMLADSVEASVRAYSRNNERFTTKIIEDIIEDIISKRLEQGQFDDCDLTLQDLRIISEEFFKFLAGYYHKRIEYRKAGL